jgi:hypothetical protein
MLVQYQPLSPYHHPSASILTIPIPNLPVSVTEKAMESLSSPLPFGGNEKCIILFLLTKVSRGIFIPRVIIALAAVAASEKSPLKI